MQTLIAPLSAFILTKNETRNLPDCLARIADWCPDIHLVDSFSTDDTVAIGRSFGATIHQHQFEGHTKQRTWALRNLPFKYEWVIALDADHRVTSELRDEIIAFFQTRAKDDNDGLFVKRRQIFRGRWLRHGGYYPKYMLKVFRHRMAFLDDNEFDYRFYVNGSTTKLAHDILEVNENEWSISFFIDKHNRFSAELASEELKRMNEACAYLVRPAFWGNPDQRTLWLKTVWMRLPLYVRPFLLFLYRYVLRCGFLDGKEGLIFYLLQSFWFRLIVDINLDELRSARSPTAAVREGTPTQSIGPTR